MSDLTQEQQAIFDAEIAALQSRLDFRKALMNLPSLKQRADAINTLRVAVDNITRAAKSKHLQTSAIFSPETEKWISEAPEVASELRKSEQKLRNHTVNKGMARPNEYRVWLIGEEIPKIFALIFKKPLRVTVEASGRGRQGVEFVRKVLAALEKEETATDETIKSLFGRARRRVRTRRTKP